MATMSVTRPEVAVELREAVQAFAAAQRRLRGRDAKAGGLSFAQFHLLRRSPRSTSARPASSPPRPTSRRPR